jgi:hypothetical protein
MDDKSDCSNCHGISLLSASYKMLFTILISRLSPDICTATDHICLRSSDTGEKMGAQYDITSVTCRLQEIL